MRSYSYIVATLCLVAATACDDPVEPPGAAEPDTLPVLGSGTVAERYTGEIAVRGGWAYTSTWSFLVAPGNAIKIWNVSGNTPVLTDSLIVAGAQTTGDVQISDDGALLVVATEFQPGSIAIYDRSNPARPALLSTFSTANTTRGVHTVKLGRVGARLYAFLSVDPSPARLVIADITDPRNPTEVWAQAMGNPYVHDVFVRDGLLFTALWDDGMRIYDIGGGGMGGSPADPRPIATIDIPAGNIHNIWWFHDPRTSTKRYVFLGEEGPGSVGGGASGDIHVIDVSNLAQPRYVALYHLPGAGTHNFWMDEPSGILYAAYYNGGVRALDVRGDLSVCTADERAASSAVCDLRLMKRERGVALTSGHFIWGVVHQGTHVYASDMRSGIWKLDASGLVR